MTGLTIDNPITFSEAIASDRIIPGDTLLLRAGTYKGFWDLAIGGTLEKPVTIKPYNNEAVIIDGSIVFKKPHLKLCDLEITDSNPDKTIITDSVTMNYAGCELIGCYIHDLHNSGVNWMSSGAGRIAECLISNNGYLVDGTGHGHAIYTHNGGGERVIERNLLLSQLGDYTIHIYSGGANWLMDYTCRDNVIWGKPVQIGGGLGVKNLIYSGNIQYGNRAQIGRYSPEGENYNAVISDNLFIDMSSFTVDLFQSLIEANNVEWDCTWVRDGHAIEIKPASWSKFIPFTLSEKWAGIQCTLVNGVFDAVRVERM